MTNKALAGAYPTKQDSRTRSSPLTALSIAHFPKLTLFRLSATADLRCAQCQERTAKAFQRHGESFSGAL